MKQSSNKKSNNHGLAILLVVALVGLVGLGMDLLGNSGGNNLNLQSGGVTGMVASDAGACVILPDRGGNSVRSGDGLSNANNVCDASINGCGFCLEQCQPFNKVVDKFVCPPCAQDGFCNEAVCGTSDPDCCVTTDADGDGFAGTATPLGCAATPDCNDNNPSINPGATEVCNGVDDDCDGFVDEGLDCRTPTEILGEDLAALGFPNTVNPYSSDGFLLLSDSETYGSPLWTGEVKNLIGATNVIQQPSTIEQDILNSQVPDYAIHPDEKPTQVFPSTDRYHKNVFFLLKNDGTFGVEREITIAEILELQEERLVVAYQTVKQKSDTEDTLQIGVLVARWDPVTSSLPTIEGKFTKYTLPK